MVTNNPLTNIVLQAGVYLRPEDILFRAYVNVGAFLRFVAMHRVRSWGWIRSRGEGFSFRSDRNRQVAARKILLRIPAHAVCGQRARAPPGLAGKQQPLRLDFLSPGRGQFSLFPGGVSMDSMKRIAICLGLAFALLSCSPPPFDLGISTSAKTAKKLTLVGQVQIDPNSLNLGGTGSGGNEDVVFIVPEKDGAGGITIRPASSIRFDPTSGQQVSLIASTGGQGNYVRYRRDTHSSWARSRQTPIPTKYCNR